MVMEQESSADLTRRASSGAVWLTVQTWVSRVGGLVTVAILARLLTPADFGVVAVAMSVLAMVYLLADLGFTTFLMQSSTVDQRVTTTTFWTSVGVGAVLAGGLFVGAPALARLMGIPDAAPVIAAVAPAVVIVSLAATPTALMRRRMRFRALSVQGAIATVLGQATALVLAFSGAGVWALIAQVLTGQIVSLVLVWSTARWLPRGKADLGLLPGVMAFGGKVMAIDFVAIGRQWVENAILARVAGVSSVGELGVAQRLVQTVKDLTGAAVAPVTTVAFARVRDEPDRLRTGYGRAVQLIFAVTAPALTCVAVLAPVLVPLLFGGQWSGSVQPAVALAVAGLVGLAATVDHGFFYGLGRPGTWLSYAVVIEALQLLSTFTLARFGLTAVAWGLAGVTAVATAARWWLIARAVRRPVWSIARLSLIPMAAVAVSGGTGWAAFAALDAWLPAFIGLPFVIATAVGMVVVGIHLLMLRMLLPAVLAEAWQLLGARIIRRRNAPAEAS